MLRQTKTYFNIFQGLVQRNNGEIDKKNNFTEEFTNETCFIFILIYRSELNAGKEFLFIIYCQIYLVIELVLEELNARIRFCTMPDICSIAKQ